MPSLQHTASIGIQPSPQVVSPDELQGSGPPGMSVGDGVGDCTVGCGGGSVPVTVPTVVVPPKPPAHVLPLSQQALGMQYWPKGQ